MNHLSTEEDVRAFLRLCLDPGRVDGERTPFQLTYVLPPTAAEAAAKYAPHLGQLQRAMNDQHEAAMRARQEYADALATWIRGEQDKPAAADPQPADRRLCPQNRLNDAIRPGDTAQLGHHFFKTPALGGPARCVYCGSRMSEPPAYRTADGRLWTLAGIQPSVGTPQYENPTSPRRYDTEALRSMYAGDVVEVWPEGSKPRTVQDCPGVGEYGHGLTGKTVHLGCCEPSSTLDQDENTAQAAAAPTWVFNARSVNRTTKHALDPGEPNVTLCPRHYEASDPIPADEAAQLALCGSCRRALTGITEA